MVAAATALCLDSTNVHRRQTQSQKQKTAAFVSLAGALVEQQQKMALNFGVTNGKIKSSPSPSKTMDTLTVSQLTSIPRVSPGTAAFQRINEVLAMSSASAPQPAMDDGSPNAKTVDEASVRNAERLKTSLMQATDNNDFAEVGRLIDEIEAANLTKNALEISRIGAVVNTLRRNISTTHAEIARKCRSLIKSWRSNVEALTCSSRPSSSCGSSSGTPSLVSPAIRRGITPRGKTITPTSQLAYEGYTANASYAPSTSSNKTSPQLAPLKRKAPEVSPNANARPNLKRAKLSPPTPTPSQSVSLIEARRNVQSTEQLIAALGMDKFLVIEKKSEELAQSNGLPKPEPIPPIAQKLETRGRKKRDPKAEVQAVPRLKIRFGGKSAEEHDADEVIVDEKSVSNGLPEATPSTSMTPHKSSISKKGKEVQKPGFSWYDKLPSVEELELRSRPALINEQSDGPTDPAKCKYRERTIILMPYLEDDEPDFLLYDYPDKEKFMGPKQRF